MESPLQQLTEHVEQRLLLVRHLADSLEVSRSALLANDAEAIARGAAHQAELCRQWSRLEEESQREAARPAVTLVQASLDLPETAHLAQLEEEWEDLAARIRRMTRVHCSLLRHLQRSLAVLSRVVDSCATTYHPEPALLRSQGRAGE